MKIAVAQTTPVKGNVEQNTTQHLHLIELAAQQRANLILFPELSLTGYEPELAASLSFRTTQDHRLEGLKKAAKKNDLIVIVGLPYSPEEEQGIYIACFIIYPDQSVQVYTKQFLHEGEETHFASSAIHNPLIDLNGHQASLAICADITHLQHAQNAANVQASVYLASVFITPTGYAPDTQLLERYARDFRMSVLMANFGSPSGKFTSAGKSAAWSAEGKLMGQLAESGEGLLVIEVD